MYDTQLNCGFFPWNNPHTFMLKRIKYVSWRIKPKFQLGSTLNKQVQYFYLVSTHEAPLTHEWVSLFAQEPLTQYFEDVCWQVTFWLTLCKINTLGVCSVFESRFLQSSPASLLSDKMMQEGGMPPKLLCF